MTEQEIILIEIEKAKQGEYHGEQEIDKMLKDAGFEGIL